MRFLLVLLALFSGLSVPQAVAAASATRVDTSVVAQGETVALAPMRRDCAIACGGQKRSEADGRRKVVWLPVLALIARPIVHIGDRARQ
jgi:hypothetical protein